MCVGSLSPHICQYIVVPLSRLLTQWFDGTLRGVLVLAWTTGHECGYREGVRPGGELRFGRSCVFHAGISCLLEVRSSEKAAVDPMILWMDGVRSSSIETYCQ